MAKFDFEAFAKQSLEAQKATSDAIALNTAALKELVAAIGGQPAAKESKQSKSNSKPKTKEFDWSKCTPKKDEDGYWNFRSYKCARARFMDMIGKGDQWLSKEEYAKATKPFVDHFGPYVKKDARA
jgi:hypothetical protein